MTTDVRVLGLEAERGTGVGTVPNHEQADARRQALEVGGQLVFGVGGLDRVQRLRVLVDLGQGGPARRAESGLGLIHMSAAGTNHAVRVSGAYGADNAARSIPDPEGSGGFDARPVLIGVEPGV